MLQIKDNAVVLFQGDSITDWGRDRNDGNHLGFGYAWMISAIYGALFPENHVKFLNRGISGDRICDLKNRWKEDCLDLKPDILSIMIGINDTWRRYDHNEMTSVDDFESNYRQLLNDVKKVKDTQIILIEPFVLPTPPDRIKFREDLDPKIQAVRKLAREFKTEFIPMDGIFAKAMMKREPEYWAFDGVHPTSAGFALMAQSWLKETLNIEIK